MKKCLLPVVLTTSLSLTACSTVLEYLPFVYTIDIKQGNIIDQDMVDQLRPNMTKRQVLFIMGSPMLKDFFHTQRWDYVYSTREGGSAKIDKRLVLIFNGDNLVKIEGDFKPDNNNAVKPSKEVTVDVPPRKLEQTLFDKISDWFSFSTPPETVTKERRPDDNGPLLDKPFQLP